MGHRQSPVPVHRPAGAQRRPALVIVADEIEAAHGLMWLVMITSAEGWPDDVRISDLRAAGLLVPSIVRPVKIATVDARNAQRLGTLPIADREAVASRLRGIVSVALDKSRQTQRSRRRPDL